MRKRAKILNLLSYIILIITAFLFIIPIYIILINSFKDQSLILLTPFSFPKEIKISNYINGVQAVKFFNAFGVSLWVTIASVLVIILFTSMTAWMITRVKNRLTRFIYYSFVFSMVVPFQMVMYPMVFVSSRLYLDNIFGIIVLYLGFGAGLSVFIFSGFVKGIPTEIEEAALIDGCNPIQSFFLVVFPIMKPTVITVGILNAMWIWNDFLLPYRVLPLADYKTIPIAIQYLRTAYGSFDYGALTALIILAIIPIVIFYFCSQKYIIKGVMAGAVKS